MFSGNEKDAYCKQEKKTQGSFKGRGKCKCRYPNGIFINLSIFESFMKNWKRQQNMKASIKASSSLEDWSNENISRKCKHFKNLEHHLFQR